MNIIDISWPISEEMTAYKEERAVQFSPLRSFARDGVRHTKITLSTHTGTHVDAPAHFLEKGKTINQMPLLYGPCTVLDFSGVKEKITAEDLRPHPLLRGEIVLLKTSNSACTPTAPFHFRFVYIDESAARHLVQKEVKAVGIDYLGIEREQPGHPTHTLLLGNDIPIIEGLRLEQVEAGRYTFICLPLLLQGLEAAPARAVLIKDPAYLSSDTALS